MNIHESDRIALLKSSVFNVICVRHSVFFRTSLLASRSQTSSNVDETVDLATLAAVAASATPAPNGKPNHRIRFLDKPELVIIFKGHNHQQFPTLQARLFIPFWNVWLNQDILTQSLPQLSRFIDMLFEFYMYYNTIGPTESEQAVFSSFLLFNTGNLHRFRCPGGRFCQPIGYFKMTIR